MKGGFYILSWNIIVVKLYFCLVWLPIIHLLVVKNGDFFISRFYCYKFSVFLKKNLWYFVVNCKIFLWNKIRSSLKFIPSTRPNHRPKISLSKSFFVYVLELLYKLNCRSEFKKQNLLLLFCPRIVIFVVQVVICSVIKLFILYFS